jgi:hypothetical protein
MGTECSSRKFIIIMKFHYEIAKSEREKNDEKYLYGVKLIINIVDESINSEAHKKYTFLLYALLIFKCKSLHIKICVYELKLRGAKN